MSVEDYLRVYGLAVLSTGYTALLMDLWSRGYDTLFCLVLGVGMVCHVLLYGHSIPRRQSVACDVPRLKAPGAYAGPFDSPWQRELMIQRYVGVL